MDLPSRVGGRLPLSSTGVGKALLAHATPDVIEAVLTRPLRRLTLHSTTDPAQLANQLAEIRRTGLAYDHEEAAVGVACVAAPILVHGRPIAALSLTLPANHIEPAHSTAIRLVSLALARYLTRVSSDG